MSCTSTVAHPTPVYRQSFLRCFRDPIRVPTIS